MFLVAGMVVSLKKRLPLPLETSHGSIHKASSCSLTEKTREQLGLNDLAFFWPKIEANEDVSTATYKKKRRGRQRDAKTEVFVIVKSD